MPAIPKIMRTVISTSCIPLTTNSSYLDLIIDVPTISGGEFLVKAHNYIGPNAKIVADPAFESALVKLETRSTLNSAEKEAARRLRRNSDPVQMIETSSDVVLNGRKRAAIDLDNEIKKRARGRVNTTQPYEDVSWIPPTSVVVERFFSGVKCMIGYLRKSMDSTTLEVIIYLKLNWDLVSLGNVSQAIKLSKAIEKDSPTA
ncbi:hypothetical protein AC1031_011448 [Aphanomyces cochlioides]|nr:hypothetical protein AC1031_011448 [Aphanomyces cochlioides]